MQAIPHLEANATTLILLGDVPLVSADACKQLLTLTESLGLLTVKKTKSNGLWQNCAQ